MKKSLSLLMAMLFAGSFVVITTQDASAMGSKPKEIAVQEDTADEPAAISDDMPASEDSSSESDDSMESYDSDESSGSEEMPLDADTGSAE